MRLFDEVIAPGGTAVIWADDARSADVAARARARGLSILSIGEKGETLRLLSRTPTHLGQVLMIEADGKTHLVVLPLIGAYQAANALTSAGLVMAAGGKLDTILDCLSRVQPVRGRLECAVINKAGAPVYVDYAPTPDGLDAAIKALRPHTKGRLIAVFGAGGDRDTGKRPEKGTVGVGLMGHARGRGSKSEKGNIS